MKPTEKSKTTFLNSKQVEEFLKSLPREQIFSVVFEKKDGTTRRMICRRDVRKHLKGGESSIKEHKNLVSVYDTEAAGYRCFDIERVIAIRGNGAELAAVPEIEAFAATGKKVIFAAKPPEEEEE